MKKLLVVFVVSVLMGICLITYADITDTLNMVWTEKEQAQAAFIVRAELQHATDTIDNTLTAIQEIVDSGQFDTLPTDLKQTLNRWLVLYKDLKADIVADAEIMEIYQWRP